MGRELGVVVSPAYVEAEGLGPVFDNLTGAGATAVGLWPVVLRPTPPDQGRRMPDLHIDGHRRLLARPLWGKRELHVQAFPAFEPDLSLYAETSYRPPPAAPAELDTHAPRAMLNEARRRGLQTYLGIGPFVPPGVRIEDQPVRVDGRTVEPPYVARNACLNSPNAQAFALAAIEDLVSNYPNVNGLILDWVEFGAYRLEDTFTCFCPHCARQAGRWGVDWEIVKRDVLALWRWLHDLTEARLARARRLAESPSDLAATWLSHPGWPAFLKFKADSVAAFYRRVRKLLDRLGMGHVGLVGRGWCPPWNRASGMDYRVLAGVCSAVSPKLFTFDHAALPRWYGESLKAWNPGLAEEAILETLLFWFNLPDDRSPRTLDQYRIPAPGEPHPARLEVYRQRVDEVVDQVDGRTPCLPITHPYLPEDQWARMVALIRESPADGMWVNMYGYLSDRKLEILGREWR